MATITGLTAERMLAIEGGSVVDAEVIDGRLILTRHDGTQIDAGVVSGPPGPPGPGTDPEVFDINVIGELLWGDGILVDTNLYRGGENSLKTDDNFEVGGNLFVRGIGGTPTVYLGAGADVNLYRQAAGILKTDGKINAVGGLQINGQDIGGPPSINPQSGSYTLVATDAGDIIEISNAGAVVLNVPTNASVPFPVGTVIIIVQTGAGQITITPAGGVTVNANPGLKTNGQWATATLIKRGTDTWLLSGNITV